MTTTSLLDQFAAAALQGIASNPESVFKDKSSLAHWSYSCAVEMMNERAKRAAGEDSGEPEPTHNKLLQDALENKNRQIEILLATMKFIACPYDVSAIEHLMRTGSYSKFAEPLAVKKALEAIEAFERVPTSKSTILKRK